MTVPLEHIDHLLQLDHKCRNIAINAFHMFHIMLGLYLMLSVTHYDQSLLV